PAVDALNPGARIPVALQGRASFNGAVYGRLDALSARGRLELEKFDTEFSLPVSSRNAPAARPPRRLHWDPLSAETNYTPSQLTLQRKTLRRGGAQLGFSLTAGLRQGSFDPNSGQLNVSLHVQNENLADIQTVADTNYPFTGVVNSDLQFAGTLRNLRGGGK